MGLGCGGCCSFALLRLRLSTLGGGSICSLRGLALGSLLSSSGGTSFGSLCLAALLSSGSSICSLSRLSLSALLGRSSGSLCSLSLSTLLRRGCSSFGGLGLSSLLCSGGGGGGTSLRSLGLSALLRSSSVATASCDTSDVNAGSVEGVNVVLVARVNNGLDSLLKGCARVGRTSCWMYSQQGCLSGW